MIRLLSELLISAEAKTTFIDKKLELADVSEHDAQTIIFKDLPELAFYGFKLVFFATLANCLHKFCAPEKVQR